MKTLNEYIIPIGGLSLGTHEFDYHIDNTFFEKIDFSEIKEGDVDMHVMLEKDSSSLTFTFNFEGELKVTCDRCGDEYFQPIEDTQTLFLKYGDEYREETDDLIIITPDQHEFDIQPLLYEYILLALPMRHVHPDDEDGNSLCNPEVIERLNSMTVETDIDPRWEALKKLTDNK